MSKKLFLISVCLVFLISCAFAATVPVEVSSVNLNPSPAIPGHYIDAWVKLYNNSSGLARDVEIVLDLSKEIGEGTYPFSLDEGESAKRILGNIKGYDTITVNYKIKVDAEALNGNYTIKFKIYQSGELTRTDKQTIQIVRRGPQVEIIKSSLTEANPGEKVTVYLTVRNVGNDTAIDLLAGLEEERTVTSTGVVVEREISSLGASFGYVERISPGEEKNVKIILGINPEAELKTYMVPIQLKYEDSNANSYSVTRYIGLMVYHDAELDSSISDVAPLAYPGGMTEITFDLFNIGIGDAKYVVAEVSSGIGEFDVKRTFIGTLEADDFDSFKSKITLSKDALAGEQPITVTLSYKDQYEQPKTISKTLSLKVYSLAEAQAVAAQPIDIWFIVVVLIVLFFVLRWGYRKIRKKK